METSSPSSTSLIDKDEISLPLLPVESSEFVLGCSGITTVTFYKTTETMDFAESYLTSRVQQILTLNPWLCGKLVSSSSPKKQLYLTYHPDVQRINLKQHWVVESCNNDDATHRINEKLDYSSLCSSLSAKYTLRKGGLSVNKTDEPLFRVTMLKTSNDSFAVIVSLSHVIGDGATYYEIMSMLNERSQPRALNAIRKDGIQFEVEANKIMQNRYEEWNKWLFSIGSVLQVVYTVLFGPVPRPITAVIPEKWIKKQKSLYCDGTSFVSTNDIVTSFLAKLAGYDVVLMAANFRGKLSILDKSDAGNYETLVCYTKGDISPQAIRSSLTGQLYRPSQAPLPGFFSSLWASKGGFTNWAGFYRQVNIPKSIMVRHQPYGDLNELLPFDFLVIFAPREGEVEVVGRTRNPNLTSESLLEHFSRL
jgi:hypothetical protein